MSNKAISLSADSVFSQEKPAATATNIHSFKPNTRSMEMLLPNQHPFTVSTKCVVRAGGGINPVPALKLSYLNFQPLEVVGRGSETQLQLGENYLYLFDLIPNICKFYV